ncbi:MAG TPA: hypothetical protein VNS55_09680 [Nocardioides sp.]|nr:hypothetical protein [Nocardioides sp.]
MNERVLKICALGGPVTVLVSCVGWLIGGVLPLPLGPADSRAEVYAFYTDHDTRLKIGLTVVSLAICLVILLFAAITVVLLEIEGRRPVLTMVQAFASATTVVLLLVPMLLMLVTAFRADTRSPELVQTLNDASWLLFITPIAPFIIQNVAIGAAVLSDRNGLLPRWVGYANFWIALSFLPDVLAYFFFSGVFAWNGVLVFWLALTTYSVFLVVMGVAVFRAASHLPRAELAPATV